MKHPRTVEEHVEVLLHEWGLEHPTTLHRHEVFFGPPDRPGRDTLGASESTTTELVGGSLLGSPAYAEPVRHLLEDDNPHREEPAIYEGSLTVEKHLATPLRSAMRRCGRMMEAYLLDVARNGGDWLTPAFSRAGGALFDPAVMTPGQRAQFEHIASVYAQEAFRRLWREFQPVRPARVPRRKWTELSESQQKAEDAA